MLCGFVVHDLLRIIAKIAPQEKRLDISIFKGEIQGNFTTLAMSFNFDSLYVRYILQIYNA